MLGQGISIPDIQGIANLKPKCAFVMQTFTEVGQQFLRTEVVPAGKIWYVTYSSYGYNVGDISDVLYQVEDDANNRKAIISMNPDLTAAETVDLFAAFWLPEGYKLACRFNVVITNPSCWLTVMYLEFVTGGI